MVSICRHRAGCVSFADYQRSAISVLGFDLFFEVQWLLTAGQPPEFASIPTLDIHIWNLRSWISSRVSRLAEIPPAPYGSNFFVCLTHDVDFVGIRRHLFDHTSLGFIYRAALGSFVRFLQGRLSFSNVIRNWTAVLKLPFVYLGLLRDFWLQFSRYSQIEEGMGATYFFVPFKNRSGDSAPLTDCPKIRAVKYDLSDIEERHKKLTEQGFEIGVHGIDSWLDSKKGKSELEKVLKL